jgi:acyl carrier protein
MADALSSSTGGFAAGPGGLPATDEPTLMRLLTEALVSAGVRPEELAGLSLTTSLQADLGVDSYQLTNVARYLEEAFDLRFTLVDWVLDEADRDEHAYTVASLFHFMRAQLGA